jgi:hypothetical protein
VAGGAMHALLEVHGAEGTAAAAAARTGPQGVLAMP